MKKPLRTRQSSETAILRGLLTLERERLAAKPLLDDLQSGRRNWSDLKASEKRLLQGAPLIEFLLARSFELRYTDPEGMLEFAEAARLVVDRVSPRRYGRKALADLRARVWAELGNSYRVADHLLAAETAFGRAAEWALRGTRSRKLMARIEELAAWLYSDLRRFPDAAAMLDNVISYYSTTGNVHTLGRTLISRGIITGYDNDPELAVVYLARGLRLIEPKENDQTLRLAAIHSLTLNLVEAGQCTAARILLRKNERLYRRGGKLNKLRFHWLKGKIAYGLGELGRAEADFHVARLGFKRADQNYDAALVSLDLALLYTKQGKRIATLRLIDEMVGTFRRLQIARETIASLLLLRRSCEGGSAPEVLSAQIRTIALVLAELERHPARAEKKPA